MKPDAVTVLATFEPRPDAVDEVERVLRGMLEPTRAEPGNEIYDLYCSGTDADLRFHLLERYDDGAALQAHRDTDHYKAYRAAIGDLLAADIGVVVMAGRDVA